LKKRYTEEQIAYALQQAEGGTPVAEVTRKLGISEQTYYRWSKKFEEKVILGPCCPGTT
jgi:putative transposase